MNWHHVPLDSAASTPWLNGGGTTRELLAWPHQQDWSARLSVADIASAGPFSSYPGVKRWFAVLGGGRVKLIVDGQTHALGADSKPLSFDGAARVDCSLDGAATQDFNLMLRSREGRLERVEGRCERACRKGSLVGVYSHDHEVVFMAVEVRIAIPPRTLAWNVMPADERIDFSTAGALWFEVQP
jgi:hypothetical protein